MKIDWKHVSTTQGYKSLKEAYIRDIQQVQERKRKGGYGNYSRYVKHFNWVICRAKHYASNRGVSLDVVLDEWEAERKMSGGWWLNFYQDIKQPKYHSNSLKIKGINGIRNYFKGILLARTVKPKHRVNEFIQSEQKNERDAGVLSGKERKDRWSMARKKRGY